LVSGLVIAAWSQLPYSNIMSADDKSPTVQKRGYLEGVTYFWAMWKADEILSQVRTFVVVLVLVHRWMAEIMTS